MRRITNQLVASELPEIDLAALSEDHVMYLRHMLGLLETGDMFHGRFVEVHVANLLRADIADRGINGWDLRMDGKNPITVEVKAAAAGRSYSIGPKAADVWVFVTFEDKLGGVAGFRYSVVAAPAVSRLGERRISQQKVFAQFGEVGASDLAVAVRAAAGASPTPRRGRGKQ